MQVLMVLLVLVSAVSASADTIVCDMVNQCDASSITPAANEPFHLIVSARHDLVGLVMTPDPGQGVSSVTIDLIGTNGPIDVFGSDFSGSTVQLTDMGLPSDLEDTLFVGSAVTGDVTNTRLRNGDFRAADLTGVVNALAGDWAGALYGGATEFPTGIDGASLGMLFAPEPGTGALLGLGLAGLALKSRAASPSSRSRRRSLRGRFR